LERQFKKVVFPHPVGPTIDKNSPSATSKLMLSRTKRLPKRRVRFVTLIFVGLESLLIEGIFSAISYSFGKYFRNLASAALAWPSIPSSREIRDVTPAIWRQASESTFLYVTVQPKFLDFTPFVAPINIPAQMLHVPSLFMFDDKKSPAGKSFRAGLGF
jgi:hypothetical protein